MSTRLAVSLVTAAILFVAGALEMLVMLPAMNVYGASTWTTILVASLLLVILIVVVASVASGLIAHVIQKRSGMSPWLVGPPTVVAVTAVSIVAMFLGVSILSTIIAAARQAPAPRPRPAVNGRGGR